MAEITLRYNASAEEVELVVDNQVAATTGPDVFKSWVEAYNAAHPAEPVVKEVLVERVDENKSDKTVDVTPDPVVESPSEEVAEAVVEVEPPTETAS